jgi:hypothetical protein
MRYLNEPLSLTLALSFYFAGRRRAVLVGRTSNVGSYLIGLVDPAVVTSGSVQSQQSTRHDCRSHDDDRSLGIVEFAGAIALPKIAPSPRGSCLG